MMGLFLPLAVFSTWILVVGARPTENQTNETNVLTTMAQNRKQVTVATATPTSVQRSNVPSRKAITATHIKVVLPSPTTGPVQKDKDSHPNTDDLPMFFLTSDVTRLTILVIAQAAVLLVLVIVLVVLCILHRGSTQRKMQRMKEKIKKDDESPRDEGHVTLPSEAAPSNLPANAQQQNVQYDVPYAHQQGLAVHIKKLAIEESSTANESAPNNNHVTNQQRSNEFPVMYLIDEDDYVKPRVLESIVGLMSTLEENEPADPTSDNGIYKVPRNSAKRSGLISDEASLDKSTLKDSKDYVVLMNYAGSLTGDDDQAKNSQVGSNCPMEEVKNVYDVPKTGRSTETFSRRTIKTKIKIFQEKMKGDKTKHVENAENTKLAQKGLAKKNIAKCVTTYDEPRKV